LGFGAWDLGFPLLGSPAPLLQYDTIIQQFRFSTGDMYKKKKVAALKHRRRQKKLKEKRKTQAPAAPAKEQ
jgi:hypothetical protein